MDAAALRALQAPLKQKYRDDPDSARAELHATADFSDDGITCTVQTWAGPARAGFHPFTGAERMELLPLVRRDAEHHALLCFRNPDFRVAEPFVFKGRTFQPYFRTQVLSHFADRAGKPAGAAVGNRGEQSSITGLKDDIGHHFFGHSVADLHRAAAERFAFVC